ncbi:FKBP-type peptidyl-prolyl cis-trans isomerase [Granulicella arctica]|uniref:FKBP-type peptidyl-prolyl cis-trans isomerase n=1 Tax=Granulicella arctica TaxID=940613 RepID=UPI0021E02266|nr:FKBP-type peptidyl-prolyl cis-trans isomerase [Granulicella arctica]
MRLAPTLLLALVPATLAVSQTATTAAKKPVAHHTATTTSTLPPNIPKVAGIAKPLYALRYIDITPGTGPLAEATVLGTSQADSKIMIYTVKYTGWLAKDGTKFDSSFDHPGAEAFPFPVGIHRVIPGWDTGFAGMHIGGKRRLFIPYQLAYGESGHPPTIPAKSDLIFDIELVKAEVAPPPTRQPEREPAPTPDSTAKPAPDPTKPSTDPATNDPAHATTPDTATRPTPNPQQR